MITALFYLIQQNGNTSSTYRVLPHEDQSQILSFWLDFIDLWAMFRCRVRRSAILNRRS